MSPENFKTGSPSVSSSLSPSNKKNKRTKFTYLEIIPRGSQERYFYLPPENIELKHQGKTENKGRTQAYKLLGTLIFLLAIFIIFKVLFI